MPPWGELGDDWRLPLRVVSSTASARTGGLMAIETMRTWKIGDVEITRIVEVNNWEDDITMLLPDATPQTVLAYPWLQPHYATPQGKMIISFQCFVMRTRDHRIMLDTCIGSDRKREFDIFTNMRS